MDFKKTIEWYNENAQAYTEKTRQVGFKAVVDEFLSRIPPSPKVLDAGCGDGRDSRQLVDSGAEVVGIDISSSLLEIARNDNPDIQFVEGDFTSLPFEAESFDGVWAHASLVHLETESDVDLVLAEFVRVLKSSGVVYIYTKEQIGEHETEVVSDSLSNHDRFFRYYTAEGLRKKLESVGLTVDQCIHEADQHGRSEVQWLKLFAHKA